MFGIKIIPTPKLPVIEEPKPIDDRQARIDSLRRIALFQGSKTQYEEMVDYPVKIVDFGLVDKSISIKNAVYCNLMKRPDSHQDILDCKVEALIRYDHKTQYGIPVAKKQKSLSQT